MGHGMVFRVILGIFHCSGMNPVSVLSSPQHQRKNVILAYWSLVCLLLLCILTILVFTSDRVFGPHNYIGEFNDMIKLASLFATHLVILVEALVSRSHLSAFWQKVGEVDTTTFSEFDLVHRPESFEKQFSVKFCLNLLSILAVETAIVSSVQEDSLWTRLWCLSITSLTVSRLRHLHMMLHVDAISFRLKVIRRELQKMVTSSTTGQPDKVACHKLSLTKNAYNILYECCGHVNFSFGFSQLFNLMQNFIQLTCDLYWIYSILYRNDLTYILVLMLLLLPTFQVIIVTLSSCEQCLQEVREIGFLLHNVESTETRMDTLVENFSLQILHEPLHFSVSGFFNMDFTLLKAVRISS